MSTCLVAFALVCVSACNSESARDDVPLRPLPSSAVAADATGQAPLGGTRDYAEPDVAEGYDPDAPKEDWLEKFKRENIDVTVPSSTTVEEADGQGNDGAEKKNGKDGTGGTAESSGTTTSPAVPAVTYDDTPDAVLTAEAPKPAVTLADIMLDYPTIDPKSAEFAALTGNLPGVENGTLSFNWGGDTVSQGVTMRRDIVPQTQRVNQVNRAVVTDTFPITGVVAAQDKFTQVSSANGLLDIQLIIDNSGSMAEEQLNLSTKLSQLLVEISDTDWRINITTTDPLAGCQRRFLKKGDANAATLFQQGVQAGTSGTALERGFLQAVNGLTCNPATPWVRPNSTIAVLFVTDEDNCSDDGIECPGQPDATPAYLLNYLTSQGRVIGSTARVYGLFRHTSLTPMQCPTAPNIGTQYSQVVALTKGAWGSICDADFTDPLRAISANISAVLRSQFQLTHVPAAGTLGVTVNGVVQNPATYHMLGTTVLEFATPPPALASIVINYGYVSVAPVQVFSFSQTPDTSTLQVAIDGTTINNASFTYSALLNRITFAAPPAGTTLVAQYRTGALNSEFALAGEIIAGTSSAVVNGLPSATATFAQQGNSWKVQFPSPPVDGSVIDVTSQVYGSPILSYAQVIPAVAVVAMTVTDANTGTPVAHQIVNGVVFVDPSEFVAGRMIAVNYVSTSATTVVAAPAGVILDTVDVQGASPACEVHYVTNQFTFVNCGFAYGDAVVVTYVKVQ